MMLANLAEHALSPWLEYANDIVLVKVGDGYETLPAFRLGNGVFRICCIPFRAYDIDQGDEVFRCDDGIFVSVVQKSGSCGFRFRTSHGPDIIEKIVMVLESFGCEVEFQPTGLLIAVNAPAGVDAELVSGALLSFEEASYLEYETVNR